MAEFIGIAFGIASPLLLGKYAWDKVVYKRLKKSIYKGLTHALENLEYEDIVHYYDLLKDMDAKQFDKLNKKVKKKFFEVILCKERVLKQDKLEKLFNVSKEVVEDPDKLKQWINKVRLEKQTAEQKTIIDRELGSIEQHEQKQNEAVEEIKKEMELVKARRLNKLALLRKTLDELNMTNIMEDIHKEYEELIKSKVQNDFTFQKNVVIHKRKEMLIKKQEKLQRINEMKSGGI